jgi:UTP:GlnB (protein PII) uridylyltransferase
MNAEIIKRGALPHYRFADHFGQYVTTLSELEGLLDSDVRDAFIDRSQMLEARMIVGTRRFADVYWRRIIKGHLFTGRLGYVRSMREELASRHADAQASGVGYADVKDGIGGLRDILMLLLMYKAALKLRHPVNSGLISVIAQRDQRHVAELTFLSGALEFLKDLRNAYRLAVGAEDQLHSEYFGVVAAAMGMDYRDDPDAGERLFGEYTECAAKVASTVDTLSERLETSLTEQRVK